MLLHYPQLTAEQLGEEALRQGMAAFDAYAAALEAAGVLLSAEVLAPSSATTTISRTTGDLLIQDGPFADTKEQLGGTFVIDVADLDAAIAWAEKAPSAMRHDRGGGGGGAGRLHQLRAPAGAARVRHR